MLLVFYRNRNPNSSPSPNLNLPPNPNQVHMLLFEGAATNATQVDGYVSTRCADGELVRGERQAVRRSLL